jgi:hypothetical protein
MYFNIHLPFKVEIENVEFRMRFDCFPQILQAPVSDLVASRKKREIE